jgi:hypothetical protein
MRRRRSASASLSECGNIITLVKEETIPHPFRPGARVRVQPPIGSIDTIVIRLINGRSIVADSPLGRVTAPICFVEPL